MKRYLSNLISLSEALFLSVLFFCTGCGNVGNSIGNASDLSEVFTDTLYSPRYASGFMISAPDEDVNADVEESDDATCSTLITIRNPWQGAEDVIDNILILTGNAEIPRDFKGTVLKGYPERIVAMSSTHVAMLEAIGESNRIVGVSGKNFLSGEHFLKRSDMIADVGYEGNIDYEALVGAKPDLVLLYGVNSRSAMEPKLKELGIPFIYIGDYIEESPLGKAEWMIVIGALTGRMHQAADTFLPIETNYNSVANMISSFIGGDRPKVMLNAPSGDNWFMPPVSSYMVRLIEDAGGEYVFKQNTSGSSQSIDMERAFALMNSSDFWLNAGSATDMNSLLRLAPRMASTPPVVNNNVWNNNQLINSKGGNDFFESGTIRPDRVLTDIAGILHPELKDSVFNPVYYRHIISD